MHKLFLHIISAVLLFTGCFPEDEQQELKAFDGVVSTTSHSVYSHQLFFSILQQTEISNNLIEDWDLGFETGANGQDIIINSGKNLHVTNIGPIDFSSVTEIPSEAKWVYDSSTGNPDSLAIKGWVNTNNNPFTFSYNVYIVAYKDVFQKYHPIKKIMLIDLSDDKYTFISDNLENTSYDTTIIIKENSLNYVRISLNNNKVVSIEPDSDNWELLFTQYASVIPDNNGVPTPYMLRGTYINHKRISVAQYDISSNEVPEEENNTELEESLLQEYFESSIIPVPHDSVFSNNWDAIGYEWKSVTIDEQANTAVYLANTRKIYFIKELETGRLFKLRFYSYYTNGERGYPWFQYIEIN